MKVDVDEEYANEKLRMKEERVIGMHTKYLCEAQMNMKNNSSLISRNMNGVF